MDEAQVTAPTAAPARPPLGLSAREYEAVRVIEQLSAGGATPSYREIADALQLSSKSNVKRLVDQLEAKGWLTRGVGRARSLRLLASASTARRREAGEVAAEFFGWAILQGWGLLRILDECQIPRPSRLTEPEAIALLAEHWLAIARFAEAREIGRG